MYSVPPHLRSSKSDYWALVAVGYYFLMPVLAYLQFTGFLPDAQLSPVALLLLLPVIVTKSLRLARFGRVNSRAILFSSILLIYICIIQATWWPYYSSQPSRTIYLSTVSFTVGAFIYFFGGQFIAENAMRRITKWTIGCIYLALGATIVGGTLANFFANGLMLLMFTQDGYDGFFNYQALGDAFAISGVLLMGLQSRSPSKIAVTLLATVAVASLSFSRASVLIVATGGLHLFNSSLKGRSDKKFLLYSLAILILLPTIFYIQETSYFDNLAAVDRITATFSGQDESVRERIRLFQGLGEQLSNTWLLGEFLHELQSGHGFYIHNWLSFWVAYGLFPFAASLAILVYSYRQSSGSPHKRLAQALVVAVAAGIFFARPYFWPLYWLALGVAGTRVGTLTPNTEAGVNQFSHP